MTDNGPDPFTNMFEAPAQFARALMAAPALLLLDEPTQGLSPAAAARMWDAVDRLKQDGVAIFLTDQDSGAARRVADRTLTLVDGRIRAVAPQPEPETTP